METKKTVKCSGCGGSGKYREQNSHNGDFFGPVYKCNKCKGTGKVVREMYIEERLTRLEKLVEELQIEIKKEQENG